MSASAPGVVQPRDSNDGEGRTRSDYTRLPFWSVLYLLFHLRPFFSAAALHKYGTKLVNLHGKSIPAGNLSSTSGATFRAINQATNETLSPDFHEVSFPKMDLGLRASSAAFADCYARPFETRVRLLKTSARSPMSFGDGNP